MKYKILLALNIIVLLTGCSKYIQLHERIMIRGIGLDKSDDKYILTINAFDAENSSANKESDNNAFSTITVKGKSVQDAFSKIRITTGKEPLYSQNLVLIIGENAATSGVNSFLDFFVRRHETRASIEILIAKGNASNIMNGSINNSPITSNIIYHLSSNSNLVNFVNHIQSKTSDSCIPTLALQEDNNIKFEGFAIFKKDKLVEFLDQEESKGYLLLTGKLDKDIHEVIFDSHIGNITFNITSSKVKTFANIKNEIPEFNILIDINSNIYEIDRDLSSKMDKNSIDQMEDLLNKKVNYLIKKSIYKCIAKNKSDVFEFGKILMNSNPEYFKTIESNWEDILKTSKYNININSKINKTGQEANPIY